jgi:hypothetical protein
MRMMEDLADALAQETLKLERETGDEAVVQKVADALATASPTMEEVFLTAIRMRRSEVRGWDMLRRLQKAARQSGETSG